MVRSGETFKVVDLAESLGAHSIQLNEIRPVGRAIEAEDRDFFLSDEDKAILIDFHRRVSVQDIKKKHKLSVAQIYRIIGKGGKNGIDDRPVENGDLHDSKRTV